MAMKANVPYKLTLKFSAPLTRVGQYRDLIRKTTGDHILLVGFTANMATVIVTYTTASDAKSVKVGTLLFKLGGQGIIENGVATRIPIVSAVVAGITADTGGLK
jgi:hypothetical protein